MAAEFPNLNGLWADLIVEELLRNGVGAFCLCPGSRSTPLALALARNDKSNVVIHLDERGAAFHALGYARATNQPAAFVCTSGTAVANAMPAVVEAAQARVPLILLTADRPPELLHVMANQAINQTRFFGEYVRWDTVLPCPDPAISPRTVLTTIDQAVYRARRSPAGPVHINCMYREPLVSEYPPSAPDEYLDELEDWFAGVAPFTKTTVPTTGIPEDALEELAALLNSGEDGLLVIGELNTDAERKAVKALAETLDWPTLPDVTSGLRFGEGGEPFLPYYNLSLLSEPARRLMRPTCVLHIGGPLVSKRLQQFLEESFPIAYVLIANHPYRQDPGHGVSGRFEADIPRACSQLIPKLTRATSNARTLRLSSPVHFIDDNFERVFQDATDLSEPATAFLVSRYAPAHSVVFLGNSMPIRDMDVYGSEKSGRFRVAANRGASGIDGNIATAAGYARALAVPVTAILGDLAFLHDLNSLALLKDLDSPVILIVINNRGGGIFSFLPVSSQTDAFEKFFATPHAFTFANAAAMFGLAYETPDTPGAFISTYKSALERNSTTLIEITTDREANLLLHQSLQQNVVAWLEV